MLDAVADYLATKDIGTVGTDLFMGFLPDKPDNLVALFEYAGDPMEMTMGSGGSVLERPGLQVRVRNTSYSAAKTKIEDVVDELHGLANETLSNKTYLLIKANQSPESLGLDASFRSEFVVNFSVLKER